MPDLVPSAVLQSTLCCIVDRIFASSSLSNCIRMALVSLLIPNILGLGPCIVVLLIAFWSCSAMTLFVVLAISSFSVVAVPLIDSLIDAF